MAEENESEQSGTPGRTAVKLGVKKLTAIIVAVIIVALAGIWCISLFFRDREELLEHRDSNH